MTTISFHASYAQDLSSLVSQKREKKFLTLARTLRQRENILWGSSEEIEKAIGDSRLTRSQKTLLSKTNIEYFGQWRESEEGIRNKRDEAERQWREKEKEFLSFVWELTKRRFEKAHVDCFILHSRQGKGTTSQNAIFVGDGMPASLLGWASAYGYLTLFLGDQVFMQELGLKKSLGKRFSPFADVTVSLALSESPHTISPKSEVLSWCLAFDAPRWEMLKKCYPLWLGRDSFFGYVDEARKIL